MDLGYIIIAGIVLLIIIIIKLLRERTGLGLKEAKDVADKLG